MNEMSGILETFNRVLGGIAKAVWINGESQWEYCPVMYAGTVVPSVEVVAKIVDSLICDGYIKAEYQLSENNVKVFDIVVSTNSFTALTEYRQLLDAAHEIELEKIRTLDEPKT